MKAIQLNDFIYKKDKKILLKDIQFTFDKNIALIGTSCSGKTTLLKALEEKYSIIRVTQNTRFLHSTIEDELKYLVLNAKQKKIVQEFLPNINLSEDPNSLDLKEKTLLNIVKGILQCNGFISFDYIFSFLSKEEKQNIFDCLKKNHILYVIVTNELEDIIQTDYTYVLNEGQIIAHGDTSKILLEEKLLKRLGFELPFMIDLSLHLKDYNLINNIYLDKETLVNTLWK